MSKERLEEIKQIRKNMQEYVNPDGSVEDYPKYDEQALLIVDDSHLDWLIEQAERVEVLERENKALNGILTTLEKQDKIKLLDQSVRLIKQNKRYREAREIIEQVYKESYVRNAYGYEDGYLDGLDTAINIIDESLEESS